MPMQNELQTSLPLTLLLPRGPSFYSEIVLLREHSKKLRALDNLLLYLTISRQCVGHHDRQFYDDMSCFSRPYILYLAMTGIFLTN